jgi:hypothetical protein
MRHHCRLAGSKCGVPSGSARLPGRSHGMATRRSGLRHPDLTACPCPNLLDCLAGAQVRGLHRLEEVQNMLRARGSPQGQEPMVGVRKRPPAADGDEAGVTIFGEDHGIPGDRLRAQGEGVQRQCVKTELDTFATALYVKTDDLLKASPHRAPWRPAVGIAPQLSDAELVTPAATQAMLGFTSEARWLRHARSHLRHLFPYLPRQPGCNKRLRKAAELLRRVTRLLATETSVWWSDDVRIVDFTPVECGRSRETVKRSEPAGWAEYGYCASHSRFFWGLRLHLVAPFKACPSPSLRPGPRPTSARPCWTSRPPNPASSPRVLPKP